MAAPAILGKFITSKDEMTRVYLPDAAYVSKIPFQLLSAVSATHVVPACSLLSPAHFYRRRAAHAAATLPCSALRLRYVRYVDILMITIIR
jgi:hypothetical protein